MNINELPEEIIDLIKEFIPYYKLVFLNSKYYNTYHHILRNHIPKYDNYVRDVINRDNEMVFKYIARENFDKWLKNVKYRYKDMLFNNYIYFVLYYCSENNSVNCREILINYLSERNLYKNLHKKNVVKYIKWNN
jgi:hypothetical protein